MTDFTNAKKESSKKMYAKIFLHKNICECFLCICNRLVGSKSTLWLKELNLSFYSLTRPFNIVKYNFYKINLYFCYFMKNIKLIIKKEKCIVPCWRYRYTGIYRLHTAGGRGGRGNYNHRWLKTCKGERSRKGGVAMPEGLNLKREISQKMNWKY